MKRRTKIVLTTTALIVGVVGLLQTPLMGRARALSWDVWVTTVGRIFDVGLLSAEPDILDDLDQLRVENVRLQAELEDYNRIRGQLGTPTFSDLRAIPAGISGTPIDGFRTQFRINKGTHDGVTLGAPVVIQGSVLVGYVTDLSERSASVQLLLHPKTSIPADVVGVDRARGLLRGQSYTSVSLVTVPRDVELQSGLSVVTAAQDVTPAGLLVGTISEIKREENEAYQEAVLALSYEPEALRVVTVLVAP